LVQFRPLLQRLNDHGVEFVIIGGVAAVLHGSPTTTLDLDVCAPMTDENLSRIHRAVRDIHPRFRMRPDKMPVPDDPERLRGFKNLNLLTDLGVIDLLGELPGIGSYESFADKAVAFDLNGIVCRALDLDTLIASKRHANREKDRTAIQHLEIVRRLKREQPELFGERGSSSPPDSPPDA
jgi:hypothetical protein